MVRRIFRHTRRMDLRVGSVAKLANAGEPPTVEITALAGK
jgi:hypothetical protein